MNNLTIHYSDNRIILPTLPEGSVDCVLTSPPYWGLRDYGEGATSIWDGDPDCEHEWEECDSSFRESHHFTDKDNVWRPSGEEKAKIKKKPTGLCQICGAWKGQLGLEPTWQLYITHMTEISKQIMRVLKPTGSYYLVMGDTYAGGGGNTSKYTCGPQGFQKSNERLPAGRPVTQNTGYDSVTKPKQKLFIPYRTGIALQEDGWICRNDNTWVKPNNMPFSGKDRLTCRTERVFHFVKSNKVILWRNIETNEWVQTEPEAKYISCPICDGSGELQLTVGFIEDYADTELPEREFVCEECEGEGEINIWRGYTYWYDLDAVRKPHIVCGVTDKRPMGVLRQRLYPGSKYHGADDPHLAQFQNTDDRKGLQVPGQQPQGIHRKRHSGYYGANGEYLVNPKGKNPGDVLEVKTTGYPGYHYAVFPEELCSDFIKSSCPPNGIVLDPFAGSGTTLKVALDLGRKAIGIEINQDYQELIERRLSCHVPEWKEKYAIQDAKENGIVPLTEY
ncbi:MAG: site-specific DNA-methyltransferase [Candidatus Aenigmatarchaeota archaeon]|nr:MAG: site-specific DNA-methyltransferase [Candidatus Aenigmarchaeota archaeon]